MKRLTVILFFALLFTLAACDDTGGTVSTAMPAQGAVTSTPVVDTNPDATSTPAIEQTAVIGTATNEADVRLNATVTPATDDMAPLATPTRDESDMPLGNG